MRANISLGTIKEIYRDFNVRNGIWEGVDQLTDEKAKHVSQSYEFIRNRNSNQTIEVRSRNGSGWCAENGFKSVTGDSFVGECSAIRACSVKFSYGQDGTVESQNMYDQYSHLVEGMQYTSPSVAQFVDAVFPCDHGKSGIRLIQFERGISGASNGLNISLLFLDKSRQPKPNDAGVYGRRLTYDDAGRVTVVSNFGPRGENWNDDADIATTKIEYNNQGLRELERFFAPDNDLTITKNWIGQEKSIYDKWGNRIEVHYLSAEGSPTLHKEGYAGWGPSSMPLATSLKGIISTQANSLS